MPVDSTHPDYDAHIGRWTRCRDAYGGDDTIKAARTKYLPPIDPTQTRAEYESYITRASYFEAVGRTVDAFTGAISRRPHRFKLPASMQGIIVDATSTGITLAEFVKLLCAEIMLIGRAGIFVDYPLDTGARTIADEKRLGLRPAPYLALIQAEQIINWSKDSLIFRETAVEPDPLDRFKLNEVDQIREIYLASGRVLIQLWRRASGGLWEQFGGTIMPMGQNKPLTKIPFAWVSSLGATDRITKPPLLGMVNLALAHYRLGADLAHGLHWTGLPTFYVTGLDTQEPIRLGSASALILKDPHSKAGFAEFKGDGLQSLERAIAVKEQQMAALGAATIGSELRQVETAEAARIRHSGETALMMGTVSAVQAGLEAALRIAAAWQGVTGEVSVALNDDLIAEKLDAQTLLGLVSAYQAGALTLEAFLTALQDGDLLPLKAVIADEAAKLRKAAGAMT